MLYKIVFSDIDGTLLTDTHQITPANTAAIQKLIKFNIPFILISARPPFAITPFYKQLNLNNPLIAFSGALILDNELNILYSVEIRKDILHKLNNELKNYDFLSINYYFYTHWFSNNPDNEFTKKEESITGLKSYKNTHNLDHVHKILIIGETQQIQNVELDLKDKFPQLAISRSKENYLEIMNKSATKSNAIRFLEKMFQVQRKEIIAFGDSFNDLDMLEYVGLGVAMGNANDEIKSKAARITLTNNESGIAAILNEIFTG